MMTMLKRITNAVTNWKDGNHPVSPKLMDTKTMENYIDNIINMQEKDLLRLNNIIYSIPEKCNLKGLLYLKDNHELISLRLKRMGIYPESNIPGYPGELADYPISRGPESE